MKCPNCKTNFSSDSQLQASYEPDPGQIPWHRITPARKLSCPHCGLGLKYSRLSFAIVATLGGGFLASMFLKILYQDNALISWAFWFFLVAMIVGVPLLMHSRLPFARDES